jgi:3D (Asp-Asp-Asp) domain-containing protein
MSTNRAARRLCLVLVCIAGGAAACARHTPPRRPADNRPPTAHTFTATAYCQGTTTASGARVRRGIVAADPAVLPRGSVIRIRGLGGGYDGVYTVADTGAKVRGRLIDIYMSDCRQAVRFGRQRARVTLVSTR